MDKRLFNRLLEDTDIFLIVNDRALCKIDSITVEVGQKFPTSTDNSLTVADIIGTLKLYELNSNYYDQSFKNLIVIDKEEGTYKYSIILYDVVIYSDDKVADRLEGLADYTYKAKAMRVIKIERNNNG